MNIPLFIRQGLASSAWPLALCALMVPGMMLFVPLGAAPAIVISTPLSLALFWRHHGARPGWALSKGQTLLLGAAILWSFISIFGWGLDLERPLRTWGSLTGLALLAPPLVTRARLLGKAERDFVRMALAVGVSIGMTTAFLCTYVPMLDPAYAPDFDPFRRFISRGVIINTLLLGPALVALWHMGYRRWALALLALAIPTAFGAHPLSAKLALVAISAVFLLAWILPRLTAVAAIATLVAGMAAFPLLSQLPAPQQTVEQWPWLPNSAHHRLTIWNFTAKNIIEHPIRGWGLDASRSIPGAEDLNSIWFPYKDEQRPRDRDRYEVLEQNLPLHPHSAAGQIWLELGLVGVAAITALLGLTIWRMKKFGHKADSAMAIATISATFLVANVSFGLWQSWWQASMWLVAVFLAAVASTDKSPP